MQRPLSEAIMHASAVSEVMLSTPLVYADVSTWRSQRDTRRWILQFQNAKTVLGIKEQEMLNIFPIARAIAR
jgi:hypothetical protein